MEISLKDVARAIGGEVVGNPDIMVSGIAGLEQAQAGQLTFLSNPKYLPLLKTTRAAAVICSTDVTSFEQNLIRVKNPSVSFSKAAELFSFENNERLKGIDTSAVIAPDVCLGNDVAVGPQVVIESGVTIGDRTVINAGTFIGRGSTLGADCFIHPNVSLLFGTQLGSRVIIHSGTVIGSDGFGYEFVEGRYVKIPQIGHVVIEDDVEIGANVTVDRARFHETRIGRGTKIDNLVQIAHNVTIGENCIIIAQVAISGSTRIEDRVILAGQVGVSGHLTIGKNAVVGAQSGVSKSLPPGQTYFGYPAKPIALAKRLQAAHSRLTIYVEMILDLKKRVAELEKRNMSNDAH